MTPEKDNNGFKPSEFFPSGFIADYFAYAEPLTDAPAQFHIPVALCTLSSVVGNSVYLQLGDKRLYPNIWALILAPSSTHRKTTALQIGLNLIREVDRSLTFPTEFSNDVGSHENGTRKDKGGTVVRQSPASILPGAGVVESAMAVK